MCNSDKANSAAKQKPNILCNDGTSICNSEGQVIYKLEVSSPGIDYASRKTHGAAVAVNNDWDCAKEYPAGAPAGNRELEPIFDLFNLEATPTEDDLLQVSINLTPAGPGVVNLNITSGAANIRIWPSQTKGALADVITLPMDVPTAMLPKTVFIEGLSSGSATIEAKYTSSEGITCSDSILINAVDLVEKQGGNRKIIYTYDTLIDFEVEGGPENYDYEWDLDGDGSYNSKPFEVSNNNSPLATCKYGPAESDDTILLTENAANKRKVYPVAVRLTGGLILKAKGTTRFGGTVTKGIRVALATFQGAPLPAQTTAGLHTLFTWNDNTPVKFNASPHTGANRIFYNPAQTAGAAEIVTPGLGSKRKILHVEVGPNMWTTGQKREDLIATVNHEALHLRQDVAVRDNIPVNNVWRLLDNYYANARTVVDFNECESHFSELLDADIGWLHLHPNGQDDLNLFSTRFKACCAKLLAIPPANAAVRTATLALLQDIYKKVPFEEMKRPGYQFFINAPTL